MAGKALNPPALKMLNKRTMTSKLLLRGLLAFFLLACLGTATLVAWVSFSPRSAAVVADALRNLVGPKPVAQLEAFVFTLQDAARQISYDVDQNTPAAPWEASLPDTPAGPSIFPPTLPTNPGTTISAPASTPPSALTPTAEPIDRDPADTPVPTRTPTASPLQHAWIPANLAPFGTTSEEGVWTAYIQDDSNSILAYRTFLQPDPERPYVFVGVVAFDLTRLQLHFQLGSLEPVADVSILRTGGIPAADKQPGTLLAAFNGGFKTINGHFGVFADGIEWVPPIDGMGTIAIYEDGSLRIDEWGTDLSFSDDMVAYRQNCPLIVRDGEINPQVFNNSVNDWGGTISGNIVTFRSGIGISQDEQTLYYFAGNNLSMTALAAAMQAAGAYQAMQLDINSYYVMFTRFNFVDGRWLADPLLPKEMVDNVERYLSASPHDFFYVTARK